MDFPFEIQGLSRTYWNGNPNLYPVVNKSGLVDYSIRIVLAIDSVRSPRSDANLMLKLIVSDR